MNLGIRLGLLGAPSRVCSRLLVMTGLLVPSALALTFAQPAFATSCAEPRFATSLNSATFVFLGRATVESDAGMSVVRLDVDQVWKGDVPASVRVTAGGIKGASFTTGEHYLVFATQPEGETELFAHLCGGTSRADRVRDWITQLGPGRAPSGTTPVAASATTSPPPARSSEPLEPAPTSSALPTPSSSPPEPPIAQQRGGCAGCEIGGGPTSGGLLVAAALGLVGLARRRGAR